MSTTTAPAPYAADQPTAGASLRELFRWFARQTSPRIITAMLTVAVVARLAVGRWQWGDLLVPFLVVAFEPFTEWIIHVVLLHWKPRKLGRWTIDFVEAKEHRLHHADPRNLRILFVPYQALAIGPPVMIGIALLTLPVPRALTFAVSGLAMLLLYEWTHYLIHAPYRPRTTFFKKRSRNHRLHHFKNEHYWFGVTMNMGDKVLRTYPDEHAVETSPTAKDLLGVGSTS